ncbi:winged helix-turn-helix domain-containing protein [Piscinibacter gummiphilus]|uniref:OmpR/PhoB-type domain-containing protein n=1 Tax=Piscinibacter gummiphilus TaxID=946333 RepID=A0A1W6L948_9BURK|nr:winged helix-turn-helix domain-containing protein [Piscinibacter gummiphilus]ARN20766.1 hypothetical protein A4W93_13150 [Piscinibacter gummiphilus]
MLVDQRQLLIDGERVRVGSRAFDILLTLLACPGEVVTKNDIMAAVWPGYVVDDNNLAVHVSALRRLLGPGAISTVPGSGYRLTLPGRSSSPPHPAPAGPPAAPLVPVVGREPDLDSLDRLVRRHPLVSLVGAAGIGKSTLAQRLLQERRDTFLHGAAWCDLDAVTDPEAVTGRIARALSLRQNAADLLGAVANALRPLSILIVLDGVERVVDEVTRVVDILRNAAPGIRVLVTSQLPLGLDGEQVLRLQPLSIPASTATAAQALEHGSVQCFVRRAAQGSEGFQLTDTNVTDVITICRRLDGIPLAIELAAARAATLGTGALASLLDHRFRLLRSFNRSISARHATLKSALDWSLGMLTPAERVVFRRTGVFHGGFSVEMLAAVASDTDLDAGRVTAALGSLVDKSLVHAEAGWPDRLRLLESTRSLAREHLEDAGEMEPLRQRHAFAVVARFRAAMAEVHGNRVRLDDLRGALERDLDNAHAAMAWALSHDPAGACALMPALSFVAAEARSRETQALWERTAPHADDRLPARVLADWALGCALFWWNRNVDAMDRWATRAAPLYDTLGDADGRYTAQAAHLVVAARRGVAVDEHRTRLARLFDVSLSPEARRHGASACAIAAAVAGDADAAAGFLTETLALAHLQGDSLNVANAQINLLDAALGQGRVDDAIAHGEAVVTQLRDERRRGVLGVAQLNLAAAYVAKGLGAAVFELAREAWPLAVAEGLQPYWADYLALAFATAGRPHDAARLLGFGDTGYDLYHTTRVANERAAALRAEALARDRLGDLAFEGARAQGRALAAGDVPDLLDGPAHTPPGGGRIHSPADAPPGGAEGTAGAVTSP